MHGLDQIIQMNDDAALREAEEALEEGNFQKVTRITNAMLEATSEEEAVIFARKEDVPHGA